MVVILAIDFSDAIIYCLSKNGAYRIFFAGI